MNYINGAMILLKFSMNIMLRYLIKDIAEKSQPNTPKKINN